MLFNSKVPKNNKKTSKHPWTEIIKPALVNKIKYAHNSVNNIKYPNINKNKPLKDRIKFTVIGNRTTKEFIYCSNIVKGLNKYRSQIFETPVIQGVTSVEWPNVLNKLKLQYGGLAFCLESQAAVIVNDKFLGGEKELRKTIEVKYHYHIYLDYYKEAEENFVNFIKSSGLYSDIVPKTCENFLRLCQTRKGGYSGTPVHRIVKDCWIQCGGYGLKSTSLDCENYIVPHDKRGVIGMANDGRNVDCSTQFYILLQPAPWMTHKYVAFGQLIEGDDTLRKIESTSTWYESPTSDIIIYRAGILNLDSQEVTINKGTKEYLQGHIENLVILGDVLYEELISNVFEKVNAKSNDIHELEEKTDPIPEEFNKDKNMNLHATQRFIRNKEEIDKMRETKTPSEDSEITLEDNAFDVEVYEYEPEEEQTCQHMSVSGDSNIKPEKPFYIPFTDVPYPREVDSTFDLKKFLKGDYCLEYDLQTVAPKKYIRPHLSYVSEVFSDNYSQLSDGSKAISLDSDDEAEVKRYMQMNLDRVSFAGSVLKGIARNARARGKYNLFENIGRSELITDEELRKTSKVQISSSTAALQLDTKPDPASSSIKITVSDKDTRPSAFSHLYENTATECDEAPTLKHEIDKLDVKETMLLTRHPHLNSNENSRHKLHPTVSIQSFEKMLNLRHGDGAAHKISSDYIKTIDQLEHKREISIQSFEFAKNRPSISVPEYQMKNRKYYENMMNTAMLENESASTIESPLQ